MKKIIKWLVIGFGSFFLLISLSLILIPKFVNVEKYKPYVENKVSEVIGRKVNINGNLNFSLFPWAELSFSNLVIENPNGFKEKNFLTIKSFKAKIKLLPLLSKKIQIKEFIIDQPHLFLERKNNGHGNWENIGQKTDKTLPKKKLKKIKQSVNKENFEIKSLFVNKISIKNAFILWNDDKSGDKKEISDLSFASNNISLDKPIDFLLTTKINGDSLYVSGKIGKYLKQNQQLPIDLKLKFADLININISGHISDILKKQKFALKLNIPEFSPKKLIKSIDKNISVSTSDPSSLSSMNMDLNIDGTPENLNISNGIVNIDESKLQFSASLKHFSSPDIKFDINLDNIDFDKYIPPLDKGNSEKANVKNNNVKNKRINYAPLRNIIVNGNINIDNIKIHGGKFENMHMKVYGKKGVFTINPFSFNLYGGKVLSYAKINVCGNIPETKIKFKASEIQVGPMINDFIKKNFLEGLLKSNIILTVTGDNAEEIKQSLNGKGDLIFKDGAIVGIDIPGMIHNLKASFGLTKKNKKKSRTDFSELYAPFTINHGVADITGTSMVSPLMRVRVKGKADIVKEKLDLKIEPKFVATLKGQGDTKKRSGVVVPVIVTGNFDSPKFRPDFKGLLKSNFGGAVPKVDNLKKLIKDSSKLKSESIKKKADALFNNLFKKNKK